MVRYWYALGTLLVRYWYAIGTLGLILWISKDSMDSMDSMDMHGFHGFHEFHGLFRKYKNPPITLFPYEMQLLFGTNKIRV